MACRADIPVPWRSRIVTTDDTDSCWTWTGRHHSAGYGQTKVRGVPTYVHRLAYVIFKGPIADGLQIDHLCRNPACCNPDHLEAVTAVENTMRGFSRPAVNARKTHCQNGHPLSGQNLWVRKNGYRRCRICTLANNAAGVARRGV